MVKILLIRIKNKGEKKAHTLFCSSIFNFTSEKI